MADLRALHKLLQEGEIWFASPDEESPVPCRLRQELTAQKLLTTLPFRVSTKSVLTTGFGVPEIDETLPHGGLIHGGLHEFQAAHPENSPDKLTLLPRTIPAIVAVNAIKSMINSDLKLKNSFQNGRRPELNKFLFWIGRNCWPTPLFLKALSNSILPDLFAAQPPDLLSQCLFLDPPDYKLKLWCLETILKSPATAAVTVDIDQLSFAISRRLALLAQKTSALGILLRTPREQAVPGAELTSWSITPHPSPSSLPRWRLTLLKCKGRQPLKRFWILEQGEEFTEGATYEKISLHIPAMVGKQSDAAKAA